MRKIIIGLLILFVASFVMHDANAQLKRSIVKKNNKRISSFHGKKKKLNLRWKKNSSSKRYNYLGLTLNSFNYFGDLSPLPKKISTDISFTSPAIGITFARRFGPRYTVRGEFRYGTLKGSDFESADPNDDNARFRYVRNLHFRNRIKELTITGVLDLFKNRSTYINRVSLTPYVFVGVTLFHHNPQAFVGKDSGLVEAGNWVDLQPLGTEGQNLDLVKAHTDLGIQEKHPNAGIKPYGKLQIAIPAGIGARYKLNEVMDLSFEMGMRFLFTDYIDDVSGNFIDNTLFEEGSLTQYLSDRSREVNDAVSGSARNGEVVGVVTGGVLGPTSPPYNGYGNLYHIDNVRGNSNDNDLYFVTTIRLTYVLGGSFRKAKFR